jgi:hypothetical protein
MTHDEGKTTVDTETTRALASPTESQTLFLSQMASALVLLTATAFGWAKQKMMQLHLQKQTARKMQLLLEKTIPWTWAIQSQTAFG